VFQKMDPWISEDPDIIAAGGAMPELVYLRGLAYIRRNLTDGRIPKKVLGEITDGIPGARKHVDGLVRVGLWADEGACWTVRNWEKWNMTTDEIGTRSKSRADAGKSGANSRWHDAKHGPGNPAGGCSRCAAAGWL
jgi:hypothetical protein